MRAEGSTPIHPAASLRRGRIRRGLLALLAAVALRAEPPLRFERISLEQGLSQSTVEGIVQDRTGFLWLITEDGLNRFDGYGFRIFKRDPSRPDSLSHNELKALAPDPAGGLWIGTFARGLNHFDPRTERFSRWSADPAQPESLGGDTVRALHVDGAGALWVGTEGGGLSRLDPGTGRFTRFRHAPGVPTSLAGDDVRALCADGAGGLWVGTTMGLDRFDPATGRFTHRIVGSDVRALLRDRAGRLWVGFRGAGLACLEPGAEGLRAFRPDPRDRGSLAHGAVSALAEDPWGGLWVGMDGGGLDHLAPGAQAFTHYRTDPNDAQSLSGDRVMSLLVDRAGVLWVGTYGTGVSKVDLVRKPFGLITHDPRNPDSLGAPLVWAIHEDAEGLLWVGTNDGGLDRIDRRTGRVRHFRNQPGNPAALSHNSVRVILEGRDGVLWVGTHGGGLNRFDRQTGTFQAFRHRPGDPASLSNDALRALWEDPSGDLWVGTFGGGLCRMDVRRGTFTRYQSRADDRASLGSDFVRAILPDRGGHLWIGTQGGGLDRFDPRTGRSEHFRHDPANPSSLSNDYVFALHEDREGTLWVGTFGGGLNRLDRSTGRFVAITEREGLPNNAIYGIEEDRAGRLWLSTNRGLCRFDPETGAIATFRARDGLQSDEFNGGAHACSPSGELFFGGILGLNAFRPEDVSDNPFVPPVVLTAVSVLNRPVPLGGAGADVPRLTVAIPFARRLELRHRDRFVTFEFAALHFADPSRNRYAYHLDGFDQGWIQVDASRRFASYTNLDPGTYTLRVRGSNSDGIWNEAGATLIVVVAPPWWGTWWFRVGALLLLGLAATALYLRRLRTVRLGAELRAAHDAQMSVMPLEDPQVPGLDVSGTCIPASEVGGDFFDYLWMDEGEGSFGIMVGDVSGKAMRSAMIAVMASAMVYARATEGAPVDEVMTRLNRPLHRKTRKDTFIALCLAVFDRDRRTMSFVNAGLVKPLRFREGRVTALEGQGPRYPLGLVREAAYVRTAVDLCPGDVLLFLTDGVTEASNTDHAQYGEARLQRLLTDLGQREASASGIRAGILADLAAFTGPRRHHDDLTLVVVRVPEG